MIELSAQDGTKVAVNPNSVWHVRQASGSQTALYAATGAVLFVTEPYAEVVEMLKRHLR